MHGGLLGQIGVGIDALLLGSNVRPNRSRSPLASLKRSEIA
jgi:hypothetical protein